MTGVITVKAGTSTGMIVYSADWQGPMQPTNWLLTTSMKHIDDWLAA
jgi:hypothetical protein